MYKCLPELEDMELIPDLFKTLLDATPCVLCVLCLLQSGQVLSFSCDLMWAAFHICGHAAATECVIVLVSGVLNLHIKLNSDAA